MSGLVLAEPYLVDVSDIFFFVFCSGRGKGESEAPGEGRESIFIEIPMRGGGGLLQEGEGPRGREGVYGKLGNLGCRGLNIVFGAEMSTKLSGVIRANRFARFARIR